MPTALLIQHEDEAPPGHLDEALEIAGVEAAVVRVDLRDPLPDPREFDFVVSLGSDQSVLSAGEIEWIPREIEWLREADRQEIPVLGLCYGAQALAAALGGEIVRAPFPEHGWVELETDEPELLPAGPWLAWHSDTIIPPDHAEVIARTEHSPHAIRIGRHLGTQFHPEATSAIVSFWAEKEYGGDVPPQGPGLPPAHLDHENFRAARPRALELFARFIDEALDSQNNEAKVINQ